MKQTIEGVRVLLVDDEPLLLESLEIILTYHGLEMIGMARDGVQALEILQNIEKENKKAANLVLVDLNMEGMGGIELIPRLKEQYPQIKILVLTTFYDDDSITRAIAGGADGYLLKDSGKTAILGAVEQIMGGRSVIDDKVMQRLAVLMERNTKSNSDQIEGLKSPAAYADMTKREREICTLLSQGLSNRQIAENLYISEGTVKNYISSIYDKTGIHDRAKLIVAIRG